jgi:hypothetical protein
MTHVAHTKPIALPGALRAAATALVAILAI